MNRTHKIDLKKAVQVLRRAKRILLTTHQNPDGDGLGSMLGLAAGLRQLGKTVVCYNPDPVPRMYADLPGADRILRTIPPQKKFDLTVLLDTGELGRVGSELENFTNRGETLSIDHHLQSHPNVDYFFCQVKTSSTGELVYDVLKALKVNITKAMAKSLFTSITTDTGSFRYGNASAQTFAKAADLVGKGIDVWQISERCFESMPRGKFALFKLALSRMTLEHHDKLCWFVLTANDYASCGASFEEGDGFVNYARGVDGVEISVFFKVVNLKLVRVSLRSRGRINVAEIAKSFGGGGHYAASGFSFEGDFESAKKSLFKVILPLL